MPRRIRMEVPQGKPAEALAEGPPKKKSKEDSNATFRSPHPGLKVVVEPAKQKDLGGGAYSITPPRLVEFDNRGSYGEVTLPSDEAEALRVKAKAREAEGLPPKFVEV